MKALLDDALETAREVDPGKHNWRLTLPDAIRDAVAAGCNHIEMAMEIDIALELTSDVDLALEIRSKDDLPDPPELY